MSSVKAPEPRKFVGFRIPVSLLEELKRIAERDDRKINQYVLRCLRKCVAEDEARHAPEE